MKIVTISDTHGWHREIQIPDGDVLIHAGDFSRMGSVKEVKDFNNFLGVLPHRHKLIIAGNHDRCCKANLSKVVNTLSNAQYLNNQHVIIKDITFFGSPWHPRKQWSKIPSNVDVLITHEPPFTYNDMSILGNNKGCRSLLEAVKNVKPALHVFGHIHSGYGISHDQDTMFVNASICAEYSNPVNLPIVVDYRDGMVIVA